VAESEHNKSETEESLASEMANEGTDSVTADAAQGDNDATPEELMAKLEEDLNAARDAALRAQADV